MQDLPSACLNIYDNNNDDDDDTCSCEWIKGTQGKR